ncbi:TIGR04149 family rSAM-modified RiPP [uncultured Bacteroides sp.]|uniref:TIGR04149 family rSAM-modified RiPP n=1 Tax=uncultured Bacteroides sp. TaxID=162156 RepID=UPI0025E913B9|nr:TIGR04149 family rSAM-modified RiPP [uncultured Bacteroides sp.]
MKKISRISLHQLDKAELDKKQQGLLFGGGAPGYCRCGSCSTVSGAGVSHQANQNANFDNGYTITGSNQPECMCQGPKNSSAIVGTIPR